MTSYTDTFGGSTIQSSQTEYRSLAMAANTVLAWPPFATQDNYLARLMDVSPSVAGLTLTLPDATLSSQGSSAIFNNKGAFAFTLVDNAGNALAVLSPSDVRYVYLMDTALPAGLWATVLFGKSNSASDASQFSGPGLKAINNTLAWAPLTSLIAGSTVIDSTYRGKVLIWTGGSGTLTLPSLAAAGTDFVFEVRNQGTGVVTLAPVNSELFDSSASIALQLSESCFVHAATGSWYSVGRGRSALFNFSQLVKNVSGGITSLTLPEASNVVQTYNGALLSAQTLVLPSVVQVYYVNNQTTGAFSFTFKNPGSGTSIILTSGQTAVLFSDGVNVINASTTTSGLTNLLLSAGSASVPAVGVGTAGNGLYAPGTNQIGLSVNGALQTLFDATGTRTQSPNALVNQTVSSGASSTNTVDRPAGQVGRRVWRTAGLDRWAFEATAGAESGSNAGSDLTLSAYNDTGALIGPVLTYSRAARTLTYTFLPSAAGASLVNTNATQTLSGKTIDGNSNTITNVNLTTGTTGVLPISKGGTGGQPFAAPGLNSDITGFTQNLTITGDTTLRRAAAPTTGALFLGNSGSRYLYWDGNQFVLNGPIKIYGSITAIGNVTVTGNITANSGTVTP